MLVKICFTSKNFISETGHRVNSMFLSIQAKAIENRFLAREFRGIRHRYLITEGEECEIEYTDPQKAVRIFG